MTGPEVWFYHLEQTPLERALPELLEKTLARGWRALVRTGDLARLAPLEAVLWTYRDESFLPHGRERPEAQPVLLSTRPDPLNGARNIALADGVWREEALGFDRAFHFFDEDAIVEARAAWKALADREGVERRYWKQDENGRWEKAA